ncbi:beta-galactosidase-like [Brevipalpus obovatus]|uniref:beta-galactosidase-like n=1 Tax=Brevipalpus obovatus TaxID=246614 RepID=UPI003D9DB782
MSFILHQTNSYSFKMNTLSSIVSIVLLLTIISIPKIFARNFSIDWENDQFLLDNEPFRYVSGSIHYFRLPHQYWNDRLSAMRKAGVNVVQTYVEWSSHEPFEGVYKFDGDLDLLKFLDLAIQNDLLVLLRVGPYICAERDLGGLPFWILKYTSQIRRSDYVYQKYVARWFDKLLPMIKPYMYPYGGPVIMVQAENEYGLYNACDHEHTAWLRDLTTRHLGKSVIQYTTDGWLHDSLRCGLVDGVLGTVDFGVGIEPQTAFGNLRAHRAHGPLVNSEYYPGWLDRWGLPHERRTTETVDHYLEKLLAYNASLNFYMFFGGTSFGLTNGANFEMGRYLPQLTSYDYDCPLTEAGDPTDKYFKIRETIGRYLPLPAGPRPKPKPKQAIGPLSLKTFMNFTQFVQSSALKHVTNTKPQTFESLGARNGFVLYTTTIDFKPTVPSVLKIEGLRDRAYVFVDMEFQGVLGRMEEAFLIPIRARRGSQLMLFVENQGRINFGPLMTDYKGIIENVTLGKILLENWDHAFVNDWEEIFVKENEFREYSMVDSRPESVGIRPPTFVSTSPAFMRTVFQLEPDAPLLDTYLDPSVLTKGLAYVNGHLLGRYWPMVGPQVTLYTPGVWLKPYPEENELIIFELEPTECVLNDDCEINFVDRPLIDAPVPDLESPEIRRFTTYDGSMLLRGGI